tara:strand:+ start:972 stop:1604 length:633 start_codon:yes stop_codon:yes gene_type:complete
MEDNNICSICLEDMNKSHIKELSCGHKIHYKCYLNIAMRKNLFIECPLCRQLNNNIEKPHSDPKKNLIEYMSNKDKKGLKRCICRNKDGRRCKNKSKIMNYGMCHIHNGDYLDEKLYPLMESYLHLILLQRGGIQNKVMLFDMGKKLIMKFCDENSTVADIFAKYYEFYSIKLNNGETVVKEYDRFYDYYKLKVPDKLWMEECRDNFIFF